MMRPFQGGRKFDGNYKTHLHAHTNTQTLADTHVSGKMAANRIKLTSSDIFIITFLSVYIFLVIINKGADPLDPKTLRILKKLFRVRNNRFYL